MTKKTFSISLLLFTASNFITLYTAHAFFNPNDRSNHEFIKNVDGKPVEYCKPYYISASNIMDFFPHSIYNYCKYTNCTAFFDFKLSKGDYDYVLLSFDKRQLKSVTFEPKRGLDLYCKGDHLFSFATNSQMSENRIKKDAKVVFRFNQSSYPEYKYLSKTSNNYYYLDKIPYPVNISDFQKYTRARQHPLYHLEDFWLAEMDVESRFDSKDMYLKFIPATH